VSFSNVGLLLTTTILTHALFSQQPVVDFSSTSTRPSVVLQDTNLLCFHLEDVAPSTCVLAVAGYGEEDTITETVTDTVTDLGDAAIRGQRAYTTGGATVCCTLCCAPLGYAALDSPDSLCLWKHRLTICRIQGDLYLCCDNAQRAEVSSLAIGELEYEYGDRMVAK